VADVKKLGVIGAGQMGAGIAQVAATVGVDVALIDVDDASLMRGWGAIEKSLGKLVDKDKVSAADRDAALKRIETASDVKALKGADFVVEAISENEPLKKKVWKDIEQVVSSDAILASNTSSISITRLAAALEKPERFIGMHFMNPVPLMTLVEIIPGLQTSDPTLEATEAFAQRLGKTTVRSDDQPGFIVNRILMPMINEAFVALQENLGTPEDIDAGMKLGTNQPMGPLTLADFIGLDTCLAIMEVLHEGLGDSKYRPAPLLRRYVDAGWLGRKTKRGIYTYD
jgi:3-hydroxybutyryl-CoA dehydrogenase